MRSLAALLSGALLSASPALAADQTLLGQSSTCPQPAWAYLAAAAASPSSTFAAATCQLVTDLQATSVWPTLDVAYILAGPSEAAAAKNLVNPSTFTLTKTGSPTFAAYAGYTGASGSNYLDTTFNPATASSPHLTQNSAALYAWRNTAPVAGQNIFGQHTGGALRLNEQGSTSSQPYAAINSATGGTGGGAALPVAGGLAGVRTVSASSDSYFNGSYQGTVTVSSAAVASSPINILYANASQSVSTQISFASAGGALTEPQVYSLNASVARYMAAVNGTTPAVYPTRATAIVGTRASGTPTEVPTIARLPDGRLMAAWLDVTALNIAYALSSDGLTWTSQGVLVDKVNGNMVNSPNLTVIGSTIFLTFWEKPSTFVANLHIQTGSIVGGAISWGASSALTCTLFTDCSTHLGVFTYGKIVRLPNGTLMQAWYDVSSAGGAFVQTSTDGGATWGNDTVIASSTLAAGDQFTEDSLVALPNGTVTAIIRNNNTTTTSRTGYWQTTYNGSTWSTPAQIVDVTLSSKPGGQTAVATPSGGVFLLGRFLQSTPSSKPYQKAWMDLPNGGSWSSPTFVLGPQTTGLLNDGYSDCFWDSPTNSVMCALAFGNNTEPTVANGFIWQAQWNAP